MIIDSIGCYDRLINETVNSFLTDLQILVSDCTMNPPSPGSHVTKPFLVHGNIGITQYKQPC